MHPLYNLGACALVITALVLHVWLATRIQQLKGTGFFVLALLVPCFGPVYGVVRFRELKWPTIGLVLCAVATLALGRGAGQYLEERKRARAAELDAGIDDPRLDVDLD